MMATRDPHQPMEKGGSIEIVTLLEFKALKRFFKISRSEVVPEPGSDPLVLSSFSRMMATRDPHQPMEKGGSIEIVTLLEFKALKRFFKISRSEVVPEPGSDPLVLSSFSRILATRDPHQPMEKGGIY